MSAWSKADIGVGSGNVRFTPEKRTLVERLRMSALCQKRVSLVVINHLVGGAVLVIIPAKMR
jgi:hypothetical protein